MNLTNWQLSDWLIVYLFLINLWAFILFAIDKARSRKRKRRIPEINLLFTALIGGSIGAIIGMKRFNHKTKHNKFRFGLPLILLLHLALVVVIFWLTNII